ncbi:MAG: NADP-dependent phosphogluconate dehydrogenase, partial [Porticoccaceae bacterium]|nr:NADP-dependent phosphogluconate dehydrogenase [Porticoccaceae bacterium]
MSSYDFGFIGLAVMGQNLVLNIESRGFSVAVFNRTASVTDAFVADHPDKNLHPAHSLEELVTKLNRPRMIQIMVQAGAPVDSVIETLIPLLDEGDMIIDGGNTLYTDTIRREEYVVSKGLRYIGAGVSGGEEGALKGPSIMPSGDISSWKLIQPIF